jgi:hypothetical protein
MTESKKIVLMTIHKCCALAVIGIFSLEFLLLFFSDFSNNRGTDKSTVLLFFTLTYVWFTIPAILSLLVKKIKEKSFLSLTFIIINIVVIVFDIPLLVDYIKAI